MQIIFLHGRHLTIQSFIHSTNYVSSIYDVQLLFFPLKTELIYDGNGVRYLFLVKLYKEHS